MSYQEWPSNLPYRSSVEGWRARPFRQPRETEMAGGNVRVRRRPGHRLGTVQWQRILSPAERGLWDSFVASIGDGVERFVMPVSMNGSTYERRLVQISGGIGDSESRGAGYSTVTLTLLVFPPEMTPAVP